MDIMLSWGWAHWTVFGCVLLVLDVLILNIYYPLWFGIAAILTALMLAIFPDLSASLQILTFCGWSVALLSLWLLLLRPQQWKKNHEAAVRELPGQFAVVVNYNPSEKTGTLRLQKPIGGKDIWDFSTDFSTRPGEQVVIKQLGENDIAELAEPNQNN